MRSKLLIVYSGPTAVLLLGHSYSFPLHLNQIRALSSLKRSSWFTVTRGQSTGPWWPAATTNSHTITTRQNHEVPKPEEVSTAVNAATHIEERAVMLRDNCTDSQLSTISVALQNCVLLAQQAANASIFGKVDYRFPLFFKTKTGRNLTTDELGLNRQIHQEVHDRFMAIANECAAQEAGRTRFHCDDSIILANQSFCPEDNAFTYSQNSPLNGQVFFCPGFYKLPPTPEHCESNDQTTTIMHELTHNDIVYSPGTEDFGNYGVINSTSLDITTARYHADTYMLFAIWVALGCGLPSRKFPGVSGNEKAIGGT